ncbi:MAG: hypothetical protein IJI46_09000 [Erysipelotrichaceae bacterium]|nr:hypothetical protein [Erysipelotrichaceae bacterium]
MANLKSLKDLSVFKTAVFLAAGLYFDNIFIYLLILVFLFLDKRINAFLYLFMLGICFLYGNLGDFIPFGIVENVKSEYAIVDKLLYKVSLYGVDLPETGTIVFFKENGSFIDKETQLKKNIRFRNDEFSSVSLFYPRSFIDSRIDDLDDNSKAAIEKIIFDSYPDTDIGLDLGYGLFSYYFLNILRKKDPKICLISLLVFILFFCFQIKFYLVIIDCIGDIAGFDKKDRFGYKLLLICFLNFDLLRSPSVAIPLVLNLYGIFDFTIDFHSYLLIISSLIFGQSDLLDVFLFETMRKFRALLFVLSFIVIIVPALNSPYLWIIRLYSFINGLEIPLRGSMSILGFLLYKALNDFISEDPDFLRPLLVCLCIVLPLSEPFMQVCFINVGQGDATMIRYPFSHSCILIDTGPVYSYYLLRNELYKKGIYTIDHLIISHDDSDHNGNIDALYEDFIVKDLVKTGRDIEYRSLLFRYFDLGEFYNDNDNSLVYALDISGYGFLFTGDISETAERVLIRKYAPIDVDFLKVSHHGSASASSEFFISSIRPSYAMISTSGMYNHPSDEVLDTLNRYLVKYFITRDSGSISVYISSLFSFIKSAKNEFVIIRS